jgi:hypothetical protein
MYFQPLISYVLKDGIAMKYLGIFTSSAGVVLLLVVAVGHWTAIGKYESAPPRKWERFDPNLESTLNSLSILMEATKNQLSVSSSDREIMDVLYDTVTERFTHKAATHTFYSNWLLYLAGKIHPAFAHIRDSNSMVANGHSLSCDQSSYLLLNLALANGIKARHVGLDGHVVMEAWYDSDWHLYDPDLEVAPLDYTDQVLSVEKLALNSELLDKYYGAHEFAYIVGSRENNTYVSYPEGSWFEWRSNVLVYFESSMEVLKFVLPIAFIVAGFWLTKRKYSGDQ